MDEKKTRCVQHLPKKKRISCSTHEFWERLNMQNMQHYHCHWELPLWKTPTLKQTLVFHQSFLFSTITLLGYLNCMVFFILSRKVQFSYFFILRVSSYWENEGFGAVYSDRISIKSHSMATSELLHFQNITEA